MILNLTFCGAGEQVPQDDNGILPVPNDTRD
jgi:hypothetical protein